MARSSMVSGHEWLIILQRSIPSFTLSYNVLPSKSIAYVMQIMLKNSLTLLKRFSTLSVCSSLNESAFKLAVNVSIQKIIASNINKEKR
ncbi:hypothetical protein DERP_005684 [Dermatophagoides pteronyssinus]|uniref:Uncharacterized protein n=1 Tax=Dermatophagoides pteronyssinus TaxID=6956 RepID=A0ABQ8J9B5_DERPT|nr:hypothetical protein DERP_005684 [Dermatophagoides pteronyssinus]